MLDFLKVLFCIPFLIYSCYSDIRTRRVANRLWLIMLGCGSVFILYDIYMNGLSYLITLLFSSVIIFIFVYILFQLGLFGGADAKSLIMISLILPSYPGFEVSGYLFPIHQPLPVFDNFFAFGVFENAVLMTAVVPIGLAVYNLARKGYKIDNPLYAFIGYKIKISELPDKQHIKLIHDIEFVDGKVISRFKRGGLEIDAKIIQNLNRLSGKGLINEVWVTPGLPFMIPITLGFITSVFYGDMITEITKYLFFLRS